MPDPRTPIAAPRASAPRVGLLASAPEPRDLPARWERGVEFTPESTDSGEVRDPCGTAAATPARPAPLVEAEPFEVISTWRCTTRGWPTDWEARARRNHQRVAETQISSEFWTGTLAQASSWPNRYLADVANVDILTETGAATLTHGLACLQQYLSETNGGQQGMIHATRQTITHWSSLNLIAKAGNVLEDWFGNLIVSGAGYDGTSPDGAVGDDNVWAYATGMVQLAHTSPARLLGGPNANGVNRDNQDADVFGLSTALVYWDGVAHGGVRLALETCDVGGS